VIIQDLWYKNAVIYNLDLETFMDSNGDGVGDFEGLMRRLDHLEYLGVDTVWVAPFQPTPNRDNGYDISDYYGVDPRHGSSGDFVEFMHNARQRGIRVIMDLVVNHTSIDHRWFQEARKDPDSIYREWYVWSKKRPKNLKEGMVFPGFQEATWTKDAVAGAWYYHRFYEHQADLNFANPEVREEVRRIIGYWVQLGVAGFRVDAVPFIIETLMPDGSHRPGKHFEWLEEMYRFMRWRRGDAIMLGEANVLPKEAGDYFGRRGEGIQMMFNFWANQHLFLALATGRAAPLADALRETRGHPETAQWANFLRNHDELDLGRLGLRDRKTVFARFAPDPEMQLYDRGIRRRLAPMLGDRRLIELAYSLMFALPGTPVLRYGEEIGMGEDLSLPEREPVRTAMQWSDERHAGFTTAERPIKPVIRDGVYGYERVNVAAQRRDPGSLLNWMATMIRLRRECPEIGWGSWQLLATGNPAVIAIRYDWRGNSVLVVHNLGDRPHSVRIAPRAPEGDHLVDLLHVEDSRADAAGRHRLTLDAYGYRWFRVGGLHEKLQPTKV
jgi:maltose alpha-D-glucosyltransferase/alpha-amylase